MSKPAGKMVKVGLLGEVSKFAHFSGKTTDDGWKKEWGKQKNKNSHQN